MTNRTVLSAAAAAVLTVSSIISFSSIADNNEIIERVKHVGQLIVLAESESAKIVDSAPSTEAATPVITSAGKATYDTACFACHGTGAAGAPVVGNKDAWTTRVSQGIDTLYSHAIDGFNAMPAKGGAASLSDDEVKVVVDYMVEQSS